MGWDSDKYPSNWNSIRKRILKRDGYQCTECGTSNDQLHVHHITPVSEGGSHSSENLRTLCHSCHEDVHGHRIPTKGGKNQSPGLLKKAFWLPAWDSWDNQEDTDWNSGDTLDEFENLTSWFSRDNAQSEEDWYAKISAIVIVYFSISIFYVGYRLLVDAPFSTLSDSIFVLLAEFVLAPILLAIALLLLLFIPILGIPMLIITVVAVMIAYILVWKTLYAIFTRWYVPNIIKTG